MRLLFLICSSIILFSCKSSDEKKKNGNDEPATITATAISAADIPASIEIKGKAADAWRWTDKTGENILIMAYTEPYDDKEINEFGEQGQTAELHSALYVKKEDSYTLVWGNDERVKSCPFDITCEFVKDATTVTDLDKNGIAEVTLLSRIACRSDVSPSDMKLLMHEGKAEYTLTGLSWIKYSPEDSCTITADNANLETLAGYNKPDDGSFLKTFGRYGSEKEFSSAPSVFLAYARQQWVKFVKERTE